MKKLRRMLPLSVVLLAASMIVLAPATYATDNSSTVVTISGMVTDSSGIVVSLRAHASGTRSSLSGAGTDSPPPNTPPGNPAVCQFPLTGSISGGDVTLKGVVTQSSVRMEIGTQITLKANTSTGEITWIFGSDTFTGFGNVGVRTG
jgi:hypothetical protein